MDRLYRQLQTKNRRKLLALGYSLIIFLFILWLTIMSEGNTSEIMLLSVLSINHFSSAFIFKGYYTYLGSLSGYSLEILVGGAGGMIVAVIAGILMTSGSLIAVHVRCIETRKREYALDEMKIIRELEKLINNR